MFISDSQRQTGPEILTTDNPVKINGIFRQTDRLADPGLAVVHIAKLIVKGHEFAVDGFLTGLEASQ